MKNIQNQNFIKSFWHCVKPKKKYKMESFTKAEIHKLLKHILINAKEFADNGNIKAVPYYPNQRNMDAYRWYFMNISGLGNVGIYFTSQSKLIKIKGVLVNEEIVESKHIEDVYNELSNQYENIIIRKSKKWFESNGAKT